MGTLDNTLFHVRAAAPSKARTLRFRNKFQHKSCLFATANKDEAVKDWFSRFITSKYPEVKSIEWHTDQVVMNVDTSVEPPSLEQLIDIKTYVYQYSLDVNWNKHPTKNCYMTRTNTKYRINPESITFKDALKGRPLKTYSGEHHVDHSY